MADDLLDDSPDDDDTGDGIDLTGGTKSGGKPADTDDDDDDPDDDSKDDKPVAKAPTREDLDKVTGALGKARTERDDYKSKLGEARKELRQLKAGTTAAAGDADEVTAKAIDEATAKVENRFKPLVIRSEARAALIEAGLQNPTKARVTRLVRQLDMDKIEVDEDDEIEGLEDQVEKLVEEFPEMFTAPKPADEPAKPKPRITKGDGADRRPAAGAGDQNLSTAEKIARRALNPNR